VRSGPEVVVPRTPSALVAGAAASDRVRSATPHTVVLCRRSAFPRVGQAPRFACMFETSPLSERGRRPSEESGKSERSACYSYI